MCGIVGVVSTQPVGKRAWLAAGRDAMTHRGPDGAGEWWSNDGRVGFGHRRLAIVELSPLGHQPMLDPDAGLAIVFNGEIYNHSAVRDELRARGAVFRGRSDTEVILAAYREWGDACLDRLDGMFALALYDERRRRLLLARDRAGEKPLFYASGGGSLRFASELKALFADPEFERRIDPAALDAYLAEGHVAGDGCLLAGVNKLPPAHALAFDLERGGVDRWAYWRLPDPPSEAAPLPELVNELEAKLAVAVGRQLVADVPVGVLLSGGVDSSLIVALAARATHPVTTFSVRFSGHGRYDETAHARLVAQHFGTQHVELEGGDLGIDLLSQLVRQLDEPVANSSVLPTCVLAAAVRRHCTVVLGGDGGDELFGGYPHHSRLVWMRDYLARLPRALRWPAACVARHVMPVGVRGRKWAQHADFDFAASLPPVNAFFDARNRRRLLRDPGLLPYHAEREFAQSVPSGVDLVQRTTRHEFRRLLPDDILVKVDRASMLNSLEVRAPFLDRQVIEFAFGRVPSALKATRGDRKLLVKELTHRLLPETFDRQRKQGFQAPLDRWLAEGPWQDRFREILLDGESLFDRRYVQAMLDAQARGRRNGERLFGLALFELWRREYRVAV